MIFTNKYKLFDKIVNQILIRKNFIWRYLSPAQIALKLYSDSKESFISRLTAVTGVYSTCRLVDLSLNDRNAIIDNANHTLIHEFNLLGSGWTKIEPLNWRTDFIHDFKWEDKCFYKDYQLVSPNGGRDIKVVWDLSRCQHLLWLAEAYLITNDLKYAKEVIFQIDNWIDSNPLMYSINWTCSMDVSIRAVHWIYSLSMITGSGLIEHKFAVKVERSLFEHLFFIANNLEKSIPNSGNHYLSDLVGMLFISRLFPKNHFSKLCYRFALKEFYYEALKELNSDGSNYENSISYHRLVTELFLYTYNLLVRCRETVPSDVATRIFRATNYILAYTKPNGFAPLIGDNDNGRFLPFVPRKYRDHNYLAEIGNVVFMCQQKPHWGESIFALLEKTNLTSDPILEPVYQSGIAIANNDAAQVIVTNGGFSSKRAKKIGDWGGTHTHSDNLSFELSVKDKEIFVDPGTYVYTSDPQKRNYFRSTFSHNTVSIDDLNQSEFHPTNMFTMKQLIYNRELVLITDGDKNIINGHYQFDNGSSRYEHSRKFILSEAMLCLEDNITFNGKHKLSLHFIVPPDVTVKSLDDLISIGNNYGVTLKTFDSDGNMLKVDLLGQPYSSSYGKLEYGTKIVFRTTFNDKISIKTNISWKI